MALSRRRLAAKPATGFCLSRRPKLGGGVPGRRAQHARVREGRGGSGYLQQCAARARGKLTALSHRCSLQARHTPHPPTPWPAASSMQAAHRSQRCCQHNPVRMRSPRGHAATCTHVAQTAVRRMKPTTRATSSSQALPPPPSSLLTERLRPPNTHRHCVHMSHVICSPTLGSLVASVLAATGSVAALVTGAASAAPVAPTELMSLRLSGARRQLRCQTPCH